MPSAQNYASSITYSALGNPNFTSGVREDLTDVISMIAPEEFPIMNLASKSKATATYHEWQMDDLAAVDTTGVPEAQDFGTFNNEASPRARTGNFVQRLARPYGVSVEQSLVNIAGVGSEFDRSKMKATKEVMRSLEAVIGSSNDMQAGGVQGAKARGLFSFIQSTAQTNNPVPAAYLTPAAQITTASSSGYTEATFKGMLQALYYQTGNTGIGYDFVVGPALKSLIALFTKSAVVSSSLLDTRRQNTDAGGKTLYDGVDFYNSDFGPIRIKPSMFLALATGSTVKSTTNAQIYSGLLIRPDLLEVAYLRDIGAQELPDLGGGRRGFVDVLATLVVKNPLGLGKVTGS